MVFWPEFTVTGKFLRQCIENPVPEIHKEIRQIKKRVIRYVTLRWRWRTCTWKLKLSRLRFVFTGIKVSKDKSGGFECCGLDVSRGIGSRLGKLVSEFGEVEDSRVTFDCNCGYIMGSSCHLWGVKCPKPYSWFFLWLSDFRHPFAPAPPSDAAVDGVFSLINIFGFLGLFGNFVADFSVFGAFRGGGGGSGGGRRGGGGVIHDIIEWPVVVGKDRRACGEVSFEDLVQEYEQVSLSYNPLFLFSSFNFFLFLISFLFS